MSTIISDIKDDLQKLEELKKKIGEVKQELMSIDVRIEVDRKKDLEAELKSINTEYKAVARNISQAQGEILIAQKTVDGFTSRIIEQKDVIKNLEYDVKRLGEAYRTALSKDKYGSAGKNELAEYQDAKKALEKEKAALFSLTQEKAKAALHVKQLRDEYNAYSKSAKEAAGASLDVGNALSSLKKLAGGTLAGLGIKELISDIIRVRGEFQQADTAIQTMLGSKEKADMLLSKVRDYAKISRLEFGDITKATQMMLGFNIEAEKVPGFIKAIGDVSMGESSRFNSLTLAFSQMSATGKLMGQDLLQMINAGFNPLTVMAEKTGKSVAELKEEMSKGAISAEMVQQAFIDATSAGGKFYNMSENAAKTINGQLSMLNDAIDSALNNVGKASEGAIVGAISGVTKLIENYETVGKVLLGLAATYGTYRTAVALVTFAENGHTIAMTLARAQILLTQKAQALLNATMLANPYVLAATALAGLVSAMVAFSGASDDAEAANERLNTSFSATQAEINTEQKKIDDLFDRLRKAEEGTNEYKKVKDTILNQYGSYLEGLNSEIATLNDVEGAYRAVAAAARDAALARGREAALASANSDYNQKYSENLGKIYDKLIKKGFSESDTKRMVSWIQSDLKKTGKVAEDTQRALHKYGVDYSWFGELNKAEQRLSYETQKINGLFGEQGKIAEDNSKKVKKLSEDYAVAERNFRNAENWLNQIKKNKSDYTTEEYKAAKSNYEAMKKAFSDVGGDPDKGKKSGSKSSDEQKKREEADAKEIEQALKHAEEMSRLKRDAERAEKDASIAAIRNQAERERAEREVQYQRSREDILSQEEEIYRAIYEQRKKAYEDANKGKKHESYENTDAGKAGWSKSVMQGTLKGDEVTQVSLAYKKMYADLNKLDAERLREEQVRMEQLVASHQSYTDKKIAIDRKYNDDMAELGAALQKAEAAGDKEMVESLKRSMAEVEKERAKSQADLSLAQLKEMPEYIRAFEDLDNTSTETLEHLIQMFEETMQAQAQTLNPEQMREWVSTIQQMKDAVDQRNPFKALASSTTNVKNAYKDLQKAQENLSRVQKGIPVVVGTEVDANGELVEVLLSEEEAQDAVRQATDDYLKSSNKQKKAFAQVRSEVDELGSSISNLGSSIGGEAGQILEIVGSVMTFTTQTIDTVNQISDSIKNVKAGVEATMDAIQTSNAILAIIGAAYKIFTAVSSLFGESEEEKQARLAREEMIRSMTASVEEYRQAVIKARQEEENWFAASEIRKLADQWQLSSEAQKSYFAIARQQTEQLMKDIEGWDKQWSGLMGNSNDRNNFYNAYHESIEQLGHAFDMEIKNEKDQLETLSSFIKRVYGTDLFGEDGMLNTAAVDSFLSAYGDRIQHDDKEILEALNNNAKAYQEWQKELQSYVDQQFGGFSDNIVDSLWSWYEEGVDVMDAFKSNAKDTFQTVAKDMLKELVNSLVFAELKEKLTSLFTAYSTAVAGTTSEEERQQALLTLTKNLESEIASFEATTADAIPTLRSFTQQLGEMSDRLFGNGKRTFGNSMNEVVDYFDDIRDAWVSTITDMKGDSAELGKNIAKIMFDSLITSNVFNSEFDEWLKDFTKRYEEALTVQSPEEREQRLIQLEAERADKIKQLTDRTKEYADMVGYAADQDESFTTSLETLSDTLIDVLTDTEDDAAGIGKKIGSTLLREMLATLLAQEEYAGRIAEIKEHWRKALAGEEGYTYQSVLDEITQLNNDIAGDEKITAIADQIKQLEKASESAETSFGDLRSTFMTAITDMENGTKNFKKTLNETLMKDLIDKKVFGAAFTVGDKKFDNFDSYVADWSDRYLKALESGDEKILAELIKEMEEREAAMAESAEQYARNLQKVTEDTTFTSMESSFVSALMNLEGDVNDFANDMKKTIVQKLVESFMVSEKIKPLLNELQETFDYAMSLDVDPSERARIIAEGYTDAAGEFHKGVNDIAEPMQQMKQTVEDMLTAAGYVSDAVKKEAEDAAKEYDDMLSNLGNSLISHLTTSGATAEDFVNDLVKDIANDMIEAFVTTNELSKELAGLKEQLYVALANGDESAIAETKAAITDFVKRTRDGVEEWASVFDELEQDTTFSGMTSSFVSALMDMDKSAEDWAKDIGQTMAQKIIEQMIVPTMIQPLLDRLQGMFKNVMDANTTTNGDGSKSYDWQSVIKSSDLKKELDAITKEYPEIQAVVKQIMEALGLETEKSGENPFSGMVGTFTSALMDMEKSAEDFALDMRRMLTEQMIEKTVTDKFQTEIDKLGLQWAAALDANDTAAIEAITQKLVELSKEMGKAVEPLLEGIKDINVQTDKTFSSMTDSWVSALMNMEGTAEEFAENVGKTMAQRIITQMVAPIYIQPVLERLQKAFDEAISVEGATIKSVLSVLSPFMDEIEEVYNQIVPMRDEIYRGLDIYTYTVEETVDEVQYALNDMKSNFTSALMDMTSTADDFSKDISKTLAQNFIENFVLGEKFNQQMEYWQRQYENIISSGMSEDQRKKQLTQLRDTIAAAKEGYVEEARAIQELLGVGTSRDDKSAKVNLADKMTYDQGDEAVGILRAIQIATEQIKERMPGGGIPLTSATNADLTLSGTDIKDIAGDMRDIIARSYLELIEIRENTGAVVQPIKEMRDDLKEVRRDIHDKL